jgi:hypothetical protein
MTPYMPEVDAIPEHQEAAFRGARRMSADGIWSVPGTMVQWHNSIPAAAIAEEERRIGAEPVVALVTPGRLIIPVPCPPRGSFGPELNAGVRLIVPEDEPQAITVIAFNDVLGADLPDWPKDQAITAELVKLLIPFLGYLLGLASAGHRVVVFEGHSSALVVACRDADLLIVDDIMLAHLQQDWVSVTSGAMRKPRILVFGRDGRIIPLDPASARPLAVPGREALKVDLGCLAGAVRGNRAQPLPLLLILSASDLPERSVSPPKPKRPWWWPFG